MFVLGRASKYYVFHSQGIQALYGRKTSTESSGGGGFPRPAFPRPAKPNDDNELCSDPKIDAMFNTADGSTYVFKGNNYYRLTDDAVSEGYPKLISEGWPGLPGRFEFEKFVSDTTYTHPFYCW